MAKNFIKSAIRRPGALHRALNVYVVRSVAGASYFPMMVRISPVKMALSQNARFMMPASKCRQLNWS